MFPSKVLIVWRFSILFSLESDLISFEWLAKAVIAEVTSAEFGFFKIGASTAVGDNVKGWTQGTSFAQLSLQSQQGSTQQLSLQSQQGSAQQLSPSLLTVILISVGLIVSNKPLNVSSPQALAATCVAKQLSSNAGLEPINELIFDSRVVFNVANSLASFIFFTLPINSSTLSEILLRMFKSFTSSTALSNSWTISWYLLYDSFNDSLTSSFSDSSFFTELQKISISFFNA